MRTIIRAPLNFNHGATAMNSIRLQQLQDHLAQDMALLKEYEDLLRTEDDPRRRLRYRNEIAALRES